MAVAALWPVGLDASGAISVEATFTWTTAPLVRVCGRSRVTPVAVRRAMAWWERLGARFGGLEEVECAFRADGAPLADDPRDGVAFNAITITDQGQTGTAGRTTWALYGAVPLWAVVAMSPTAMDEAALRHELGHALGYAHVDVPGHVMYPRRDGVGERAEGLSGVGTLAGGRR